ncbi:MAG: hypothetical protein DRP93_03860 [Candidatus Neomarinimicrobiota bacterium]|nr:MAG: hypothetical protein DRP93_03860 [Candidatus Neomarinimicrobiota bacterium]
MLLTIFWAVFFLVCPAFILWICSKNKFLDNIGAIVLCYIIGLLIGNVGILPDNIAPLQDTLNMLVIPIALPLIFFSMNLRGWGRKQAGMTAKAFTGALVSIIIASFIVFTVFNPYLGDEGWKMSGMLIGCYTGGTPNLAAIGSALKINSSNFVAVNTADVFVGAILLMLLLSVIPRIFKKILLPFKKVSDEEHKINMTQMDSFEIYFKGFTKRNILPLLGAFGISVLIFAIGGGASLLVPEGISSVVAILIITTLGVLASFIPKIRNIKMTFQLGHYFLLVFALVISSMANIHDLAGAAPVIMLYISVLYIIAFTIHGLLSKLMKVDSDTHLVAMTALIYSPPFVPVVAAVLKNKQVIMTGMLVGIVGWVIGNYAGIGFAYLMQLIFGG